MSFVAKTKKTDFGFRARGTGNAFKVFGTVIDIAKMFMQFKHPAIIMIDNDMTERSRFAVNKRIAESLADQMGYRVSVDDDEILLTNETDLTQDAGRSAISPNF